MIKRTFQLLIALLFVLGLSVHTHAALLPQGQGTSVHGEYNLIYDSDLDITWYDYTNIIPNISWGGQNNWALNLTVYAGGTKYSDWRLPAADPGCGLAYNCTGSEMGHLYYTELLNAAGGPLTDAGDFDNLSAGVYWSNTMDASFPGKVYNFNFSDGKQDRGSMGGFFADYANGIAVHPGNVIAVPEPGTMLLLAGGLVGLGLVKRRFGA